MTQEMIIVSIRLVRNLLIDGADLIKREMEIYLNCCHIFEATLTRSIPSYVCTDGFTTKEDFVDKMCKFEAGVLSSCGGIRTFLFDAGNASRFSRNEGNLKAL